MISYLKGKITEINETSLTVEMLGCGYQLFASATTLNTFNVIGKDVTIYTHLQLKEDGATLFGFYSKQEKEMFLQLINVSGVGPKVAIAVLGGLKLNDLKAAILDGDFAILSSVKGIGKKTAERIVLELKDKIDNDFGFSGGEKTAPVSLKNQDAIMALISMGYSKQESSLAVASIKNSDGLTVEQIIIEALKSEK